MPDEPNSQNQLADEKFLLPQQVSEKANDSITASGEQGMVLQLADGSIIACNKAAEKLLGLTVEQLLGRNSIDPPWQTIHEDGSVFKGETHPPMVALKTGKPCLNVVMGLYKPNGELVWLLVNSQPLFQTGGIAPYAVVTTLTDITASKRQQAFENSANFEDAGQSEAALVSALRENPNLIQQIAGTTPGMMYLYDFVEQRLVYVNRQVAQILGYTQEELQTKPLQSLLQQMHPDDFVRLSTHLKNLNSSRDGEVVTFEFQYPQANGEWRWLCSYDTVLRRTAEGLPQRILGITHDITEQRRVEVALRQSKQKFELAAAAVNCLIYDWDFQRQIVERTQGLTQILGYKVEEAEPTKKWWKSRIHPEDQASVSEQFRATMTRGNRFRMEYRVRHKDNRYLWIEDRGFAVRDADNRLVRIVGTVIDISDVYDELRLRKQAEADLKESQEWIRIATTAANLGMWFWNLTADELIWTEKCKALFGLSPDAEISYEIFLNSLHPEDRQRTHEAVTRALEDKTEYNIEYRTIWSDNSVHWIAAKGRAFYDSKGKPVRMMGTAQDITQTKQLEIALRQQAEELTQANNIKDQFLAILSHELRSPLNPILGWAKLLKSRKFDETATYRALDTIERNAKLQIQLIDDLLDVSRILRGKLTLNFAAVELTSVIDAAVETVRLSAEAKSIQLTTQLDSNIGQVLGDSYRLQQVVGNLLTNAIKFTPQGGRVEVRLVVERLGDGETRATGMGDGCGATGVGRRVWGQGELLLNTQNSALKTQYSALIQVTDTGFGISPEFLPHVFEYFRQADSSTTRKFGGLGLGLAIVRHLVELHGGTVDADSPGEGKGATFTVRLPVMKNEQNTNQDELESQACTNLEGVKILVVDDDADARDFLSFLLEEYGAIATVASSAAEALTLLPQCQPDLLVSDLGMPEMDGYSLIRQIRIMSPQQGGKIPAIALTAYAGDSDREKVLAAGFQKHLPKPVEPDELIEAIADLLAQRRDI
ncbi:MAG: PAS domain-containing protein [Heteroscytonema crispum UTEX LB 1556]